MADLTVNTYASGARDRRGVAHIQKTGTSADITTALAVVPALANHTGVIDDLILSSAAAEIFTVMGGSDQLMQNIYTEATKQLDVLPGNKTIRSDTVNEAIGLKSASSGNIFYTIWYHYEPQQPGARAETALT